MSTVNFIHEVIMTDEEKLQMYRDSCTFDELARMHIELEKHIKPTVILPDEN